MRGFYATCHPERSEAESKDPAEVPEGSITGSSTSSFAKASADRSLGMTAVNIERSTLSVRCFASILEQDVACPIPDIHRAPRSRFTAC